MQITNVTLFGKRVFTDVIRWKIWEQDHPGLRWTLTPMTSVFIRDEKKQRYIGVAM